MGDEPAPVQNAQGHPPRVCSYEPVFAPRTTPLKARRYVRQLVYHVGFTCPNAQLVSVGCFKIHARILCASTPRGSTCCASNPSANDSNAKWLDDSAVTTAASITHDHDARSRSVFAADELAIAIKTRRIYVPAAETVTSIVTVIEYLEGWQMSFAMEAC